MTTAGRVAGKTALVTGGASGIGLATARLLAREGARVAVADLDERGADGAARAIRGGGGEALPLRLDVTSEAGWQSAVDAVVRTWDRLDVLVNSAGVADSRPLVETTLEQWRRVLAVNLDGTFLGTRAALRVMVPQGSGSVVNVASASGIKSAAGAAAYCSSKAAVLMLTRTAALECTQAGAAVRVNAVAPGGVKTPMWETTPMWPALAESDEWKAPRSAAPGKRFAEPDEVAQVILFLACDESSYVTAACVAVDAGYTA